MKTEKKQGGVGTKEERGPRGKEKKKVKSPKKRLRMGFDFPSLHKKREREGYY